MMTGLLFGCEQWVGIRDPGAAPIGGGDAPIDPRDAELFDSMTIACAPIPTFGAPVTFSAVGGISLAVGDLNNDGLVDIAVATKTDVLIFNGGNAGSFSGSHTLGASPVIATGLAIADLDQDGRNDLVTWDGFSPDGGVGASGAVRAHRQSTTAAGTFLAAQSFIAPGGGNSLQWVRIGKLDDDALPDLVVYTQEGTVVFTAVAGAPGTFATGAMLTTDGGSRPAAVTDIDGDGFDDVAFVKFGGLEIKFNNTATPGTFAPTVTVGSQVDNVAIGTYSSTTPPPGKDLLLFSQFGGLFTQTSPRSFLQQDAMAIVNTPITPVDSPTTALQAIDINGDGTTDVGIVGHAALQCPLAGKFFPSQQNDEAIRFDVTPAGPRTVQVLADVNSNGKPDLIRLTEGGSGTNEFLTVRLQ